jgi:hypothetical protein
MDEARTPELKMATDFVPSMCIPWKAFGLSCGVGVVPIGAFHKKNFRCILVSSRSCTMLENEGKRCFTSSLNYWSNKTLESNMSQSGISGSSMSKWGKKLEDTPRPRGAA